MGLILIITPRDPTHDSTVQQGTVEYEALAAFHHGIDYKDLAHKFRLGIWHTTDNLGHGLSETCHAYELASHEWSDIPDVLVLPGDASFICTYDSETKLLVVHE